jgi:hypothetical protein
MYRLDPRVASDDASDDTAMAFLRSCTSTPATPANASLVRTAAGLMRAALDGAGTAELRDLVIVARAMNVDVHDIFAAAQQVVMDSLLDASPGEVQSAWKRLLALSVDVLPLEPFDPADLDEHFLQSPLAG